MKQWWLFSKYNQIQAGPFASELEADTHLMNLRSFSSPEETDGFYIDYSY